MRWGMIGCGAVTERKSAPAYGRAAGCRLVAVASRSPGAASDYAARNGIANAFADPAELIRSPDVDAVYVATPPSSHLHWARQAAEAGKPCCVEKPMAMSYAEAREMAAAFEAAGQPLFVAYYRRSLPRFRQVASWISGGAIGEPRHVHWTLLRPPSDGDLAGAGGWRTDSREAPGGYFDDLACHGLDLFDWLIGPIAEASGVHRNRQGLYSVPDSVAACWAHESGATGSGVWNFGAAARADEVRISGSEGEIRFAVFDESPLLLETASGAQAVEVANPDPIQLHHVEAMVRHLAGGEQHPSLARSAARTEWVADRILAGLRG